VLGTRFEVPASTIRKVLPKELQITEYGRVRRLNGGDNMQARELVALGVDSRDMSFVRASTYIYIYSTMPHYLCSTSFSLTYQKH
jgi:hypothetical protein